MKKFTKEWWLSLSRFLERDRGWIWREEPTYFLQLEKYDDEYINEIIEYCFKRYAEAYHREKMAFTESPLMTMHKKGQEGERKKILGIIEEELQGNYLVNKERLIEKIKE